VAAALAEGLSLDEIVPRMEALSPSTGRLEPVALPSGAWVVRDEFKASIETVEAALDTMADIPAPRRIVVLGKVFKPKEEEGRLYERLGARVASFADRAVFVGDTVKGRAFLAGAVRAGLNRESIVCTEKAIPGALEALPQPLKTGDVVLLKGCSEQRLDRIALALMGYEVRCQVRECTAAVTLRCHHCKMLKRGWKRKTAVDN
jgi:UDP-N-acetylmuramoyl-tripeptide--D-alanyl-D-alanine ligase